MRRFSAALLAALLGLAVLAVGVGVAGAQRERHVTGTNQIRPFLFGVEVPPGKTACQPQENIPDTTGGVRVRAGTFGKAGPRIAVTITTPGDPAVRGAIAAGWREGDIVIDVPKVSGDRLGSQLCFSNQGTVRLALAGENFPPDAATRIDGAPLPSRVHIQYVRPRAESWWRLGPELARRVATVRAAVPGAASLYLWALIGLTVTGASIALVLREGRE